MRLAVAGLEHGHRRLVGMHHAVLQQLVSHGVHQRLQLHTAGAHPLSERGTRDGETSAAEDRFLAVQRQVIGVLGHQHLRQQPGGGDAFVDDVRIDGDLGERLALRTSPLAPDVALDAEDARHIVQLLGHVLAHALHLATAGTGGRVGLVADLAPRQVGWQRRALGNLLLFNLGGRLRFLQRIDLGGHGCQVGLDLVFEQALLFGVEAFGLSCELHAL